MRETVIANTSRDGRFTVEGADRLGAVIPRDLPKTPPKSAAQLVLDRIAAGKPDGQRRLEARATAAAGRPPRALVTADYSNDPQEGIGRGVPRLGGVKVK